ncbi:MAG: tape measure protein [Waterburya sp.]
MAITLETLLLEFQADFSGLESAMDKASNKAKTKMKALEQQKITPGVDLEPLHDLNTLLDIKQKHLKETVEFFKNNPIVTYTEEVNSGGKSSGSNSSASNEAKEDTKEAIKEGFKSSQDLVKNMIRESIKAGLSPLRAVLTGAFEGIGRELSREISQSLTNSISQEILNSTGKSTKQLSDELTQKLVNKIATEIKNIKEDRGGSSTPSKPKPSDGGAMVKSSKSSKLTEEYYRAVTADIVTDSFASKAMSAAKKRVTGALSAFAKGAYDTTIQVGAVGVGAGKVAYDLIPLHGAIKKATVSLLAVGGVAMLPGGTAVLGGVAEGANLLLGAGGAAGAALGGAAGNMASGEVASITGTIVNSLRASGMLGSGFAAQATEVIGSTLAGSIGASVNGVVSGLGTVVADLALAGGALKVGSKALEGVGTAILAGNDISGAKLLGESKAKQIAKALEPARAVDATLDPWILPMAEAKEDVKMLASAIEVLPPASNKASKATKDFTKEVLNVPPKVDTAKTKAKETKGGTNEIINVKATSVEPSVKDRVKQIAPSISKSEAAQNLSTIDDVQKRVDNFIKSGIALHKADDGFKRLKKIVNTGNKRELNEGEILEAGNIFSRNAFLSNKILQNYDMARIDLKDLISAFPDKSAEYNALLSKFGITHKLALKQLNYLSGLNPNGNETGKMRLGTALNTKAEYQNVGKDIETGLRLGSNPVSFGKLGREQALAQLKAFKSALRIQSPSKEYSDAGSDIYKGAEIGANPSKFYKLGQAQGKALKRGLTSAVETNNNTTLSLPSSEMRRAASEKDLRTIQRQRQHKREVMASDVIPDTTKLQTVTSKVAQGLSEDFSDLYTSLSNVRHITKEQIEALAKMRAAYAAKIAIERTATADILNQVARQKIIETTTARHTGRFQDGLMSDKMIATQGDIIIRAFRRQISKMTADDKKGAVTRSSEMMNNIAGMAFSSVMMAKPSAALGLMVSPLLMPMSNILIALAGVSNMLKPVVGFAVKSITNTEATTQKFDALTTVRGGDSGKEMDYVKGLANKYKQDVKTVMQGYTDMSAAAYRTTLQGQSLNTLFEGVLASARVARLTTEETQGIVRAYTQMIGKNAIQMEELRGQLGDRFAPAMQDFASALGVGTEELMLMARQGKLTASDLATVGQFMNAKYGDVALATATSLSSSLTVFGNAWFELQSSVAESTTGMLGSIVDMFAKVVNFLPRTIEVMKTMGSALVIGVAAMFAVGMQQILMIPKIANVTRVVQTVYMTAWSKAMKGLTPFFIASFVDTLDKVLGVENTNIDNIAKGFTNLFKGIAIRVNDGIQGITGKNLLAGIFEKDGKLPEFKLPSQEGILGKFNIPSGLVELPALMLMIQQTILLLGAFAVPKMKELGKTFSAMGKTVKESLIGVGSGLKDAFANRNLTGIKNISNALMPLNNTTAALAKNMASLGIQAGVAFGLMALARSKFTSNLLDDLDKSQKKLGAMFIEMRNLAEKNKMSEPGTNLTPKGFNSAGLETMGLEINPLKVLGATNNGFNTDDLQVMFSEKLGTGKNSQEEFARAVAAFNNGVFNFVNKSKTGFNKEEIRVLAENKDLADAIGAGNTRALFAQKDAIDIFNKIDGYSTSIPSVLKQAELEPGKETLFTSGAYAKGIEDVKAYNAELEKLSQEKLRLLNAGNAPDSEIVSVVSTRARDLLEKRATALAPISEPYNKLKATKDELESQVKLIENSVNNGITRQFANVLLARLNPQLKLVKDAIDYANGQGINKLLDPVADNWGKVTGELRKFEYELGRVKSKAALKTTNELAGLYGSNVDNLTLADTERNINMNSMDTQVKVLEQSLAKRQALLQEMMSVPMIETDETKRKELEALQKEVSSNTQELADAKLSLAKARREIAMIQETRRLNSVFGAGQLKIDNIANRTAIATFDNNIKSLTTKLNTAMNSATSAIFDAQGRLREANLNLSSNVQMINEALSLIGKNIKQSTKDWFVKTSGLDGNFDEIIRKLTARDISRISESKAEEIDATPERRVLIKELGDVAALQETIKQNKTSQLQAQLDIKQQLKQQKEAYESFVQTLESEVDSAKAAVKDLKIKNQFTEFAVKLKEGLTAGTTSIIKTLTEVISNAFNALPGIIQTTSGISSTIKQNERTIKDFEKQLNEQAVDTKLVGKIDGLPDNSKPEKVAQTTSKPDTVVSVPVISDKLQRDYEYLTKKYNGAYKAPEQSKLDAQLKVITETTKEATVATKEYEESQNTAIAANASAKSLIQSLNAAKKEEIALLKEASGVEFKSWLIDFRDSMAKALTDVSDASRDAANSVGNFTDKLSDLNTQYIKPLSPKDAAVKDVDNAYDGYLKELNDFSLQKKRALGIADSIDLSNKSAKEIEALISDKVDVKGAFSKIAESIPEEMRSAITGLEAQYEQGLITNKEALARALESVESLKTEAGRKQVNARDEATNRVIRETNSKQSDYRFDQINKVLDNNNYGFQSESQKDKIARFKDELKIKDEYRKAIEAIDDAERKLEITEEEASARRQEASENQIDSLIRVQKQYSVLEKVLTNFKESASQAIADSTINLGKALFDNGGREKALADQRLDYAEKLNDLAKEYGDSPEQFRQMKEQLDVINNSKLDGIKSQFSVLGSVIGTLKTALGEFATQLAKTLAQRAASSLIGGIFGGGGGIFGGLFGGGTQSFSTGTDNFSSGTTNYSGGVMNYSSGIPKFGGGVNGMLAKHQWLKTNMQGASIAKDGIRGVYEKYKFYKDNQGSVMSGGNMGDATPDQLGVSVRNAMLREGSGATPAVLHKGEAVLSTRNKDAQLYRALRQNGTWEQLKRTTKVNNFANGTDINVGRTSGGYGSYTNQNHVTTNVTVIAKDYNSFNRSASQMRNEQASRDNMTARRFS